VLVGDRRGIMPKPVKPKSICPHCAKETEGSIRDKGLYFMIVCGECDTILGVIPKFYQKCTWKMPESQEVPASGIKTPVIR
jgi:hypothetical protein